MIREYGSEAFGHAPKEIRKGKLCAHSILGILVWYNLGNLYRILFTNDTRRSVVVSKNVRFDESRAGFSATSYGEDHSAAVDRVEEHATANAEGTSAEESEQDSDGGPDYGDKESQPRSASTVAKIDAMTFL